MKSVMITGGTGFIGRALAERLRPLMAPGERILAPGSGEVDLVNRERTFEWLERNHWATEVSHIFHLAAIYKAGGWPATHPATQFHANMAINLNVLEGWKRFFPQARLTNVVSYCMYPDHDRPHPETELWGTEPEPYLFAYAFTKKALVIGHRAYAQEFGLRASSLVLPTVYGPRDNFAENSHVMGALIGKFVRAARDQAPTVEVWGDGNQEREFIHVDDVVDGLLHVSSMEEPSDVLNLGVGRTYSIRHLAETIQELSGFQGKIVFNPQRFVGAMSRRLDIAKISQETDWKAKVDLRSGIASAIEWYRRQLDAPAPVAGA
jgi:GDP-L-fucose synthase